MSNIKKVQDKANEFLHDLETRKSMQILERKIGGLNIFSILKTESAEIRHSNVLAWLIDPNGNHGLDTLFAEVLFVNISNATKGNEPFISKLVLNGLNDIIVYREKNNIDILIVSKKTNQIILIENKTGSGLHSDQLNKYNRKISEQYTNYEKLLLYLDSNQDFSGEIGEWQYVDYSVVKSSLEYVLENDINIKLEIILKDYLTIIRRTLMNDIDKETQELCDGIYSKYREVFDFILANRSNKKVQFFEGLERILFDNADNLGIVIKKEWQAKFYKRFTLKGLQVQSDKDEGWADNQLVLLEILGDPEKWLGMKLYTYAGKNNDIKIVKEIRSKLPSRIKSDNNPGKEYNNTQIKWNGDIDDAQSEQDLINEIKRIINSKNMQGLFSIIKSVINSN